MGNKKSILISIILLMSCVTPSLAKKSYTFVTGNWLGQAHYYKNGQFKSCTINAKYQSGTEVFFVINENLGWAIGINNSSWELEAGKKLKARIQIDEKPPLSGSGQNLSSQGFYIIFEKTSELLNQLKLGRELGVEIGNIRAKYELKGTLKALDDLKRCALLRKGYKKNQLKNKVTHKTILKNSLKPSIKPLAKSSNEQDTMKKEEKIKRESAVDYVSRLLESRGVTNYKILEKQKHPLKGYDVMWSTGNLRIGGVKFFDGSDGLNLNKLAGRIIGQDAAICDGEFASAKKIPENQPSPLIRKISTVCRMISQAREIEYFIFKRKDGIFVKIAQTSSPQAYGNQSSGENSKEQGIWSFPDQSIINILPKK